MPPNKELGTGEGESPLAIPEIKTENMAVRTMNSDAASIQNQGGGQPMAYTPNPVPPKTEVFVPPQAEVAPLNPSVGTESVSTGGKNPIILGLASFIIVVALGAIGWFVVYPNIAGPEEAAPAEQTESSAETALPPEEPPVAEEAAPIENSTSSASSTEADLPETKTLIHKSFFKTAADAVTEFNFLPATADNYKAAFPAGTAEVALLKEVIFKTETSAYASGDLLAVLAPKSLGEESGVFEEDFTAFSYTDKNGVWPGLILKIAEGKKEMAAGAIKKLETSEEAANFFGGTIAGTPKTWKDGKIGSYAGRYLAFASAGASLNYAIAGDYLIISGSYTGAQEAAKRAGL